MTPIPLGIPCRATRSSKCPYCVWDTAKHFCQNKQIGDWCFQVKGHTVKCHFCSVIYPLCATNQHLPVYRDRGIPFFLVTGMQNGHWEKFGADVPTILCISHFLLLFLLLLQPCDFPSASTVAPLEVCKWTPC